MCDGKEIGDGRIGSRVETTLRRREHHHRHHQRWGRRKRCVQPHHSCSTTGQLSPMKGEDNSLQFGQPPGGTLGRCVPPVHSSRNQFCSSQIQRLTYVALLGARESTGGTERSLSTTTTAGWALSGDVANTTAGLLISFGSVVLIGFSLRSTTCYRRNHHRHHHRNLR
jgi:hypothetical protein